MGDLNVDDASWCEIVGQQDHAVDLWGFAVCASNARSIYQYFDGLTDEVVASALSDCIL